MTKNDSTSGPEPPEQGEPLSATGLFLRAFDAKSEARPSEAKQSPLGPEGAESGRAAFWGSLAAHSDRPAEKAPTASVEPMTPANGPGDFTKMFQKLEPLPIPSPTAPRETPVQSDSPAAAVKAEAAPAQEPGEFTRIFVAGSAANPTTKPAGEAKRPSPPAQSSSRAKGFSSPGASDSASAEGSFTQFFKAAPSPSVPGPSAAGQSASPRPTAPPPLSREMPFKSEPIFRAPENPPSSQGSPSVTSLLASLSSLDSTATGSLRPEPAAYRPEPLSSYTAPARPDEPPRVDSGGVTRLIERLAQEPPSRPAPLPPAPFSPPESSGPGEFTRMMMSPAGDAERAAAPAAQSPAPVPGAFAPPALPAMPAAPQPAMPAVAPPAFKAPAVPPVPKPAPPPAPALAAPKGKLEAMVPILLVINTFLLIVILMVVIFSIKSR